MRPAVQKLADLVYRQLRHAERRWWAGYSEHLLNQVPLLGAGVKVNGKLNMTGAKYAVVGNNVHIGDNAFIRAEGGLVIGDNTHISRNVTIYTINHDYEGEALPYDDQYRYRPVTIGRNVWIGMGVTVAPGTRIGDGAIIGMGATVAGEIPAMSIVASASYQVLKERDRAHYERLDMDRLYGGASGRLLSEEDTATFRPSMDEAEPFFVVSTGRSGSTTIARTLSMHPKVVCLHEPRVQLIKLSTEWAHRTKSENDLFAELNAIYSASVCPTSIYGESDQNISLLIRPLLDRFPTAKIIWLLRDGRDVVASSYAKGWYQPGPHADGRRQIWDNYRIQGDSCGDVSPEAWDAMSAFERNCWYWSYVNRTVQNALEEVDRNQWIMVRLEEINDATDRIFNFLGVPPVPVTVTRHNTGISSPRRHATWSADEKDAFEKICGAEMDLWYSGWRIP